MAASMEPGSERGREAAKYVRELLAKIARLEELHPGRRFTPDGHMVGSLGEAEAENLFQIDLVRPSSTGHDALTRDNRTVEIKATFGVGGRGFSKRAP